ncbi:MAG: hypothetical protein WBV94_25580 [Blastocatellia bacterium]
MPKYKALFQRSRFFIIVVLLVGFIYFGGNVWSSNKSQKGVVLINNRTQTLRVINAEKHEDHIKLSLRNDSQKSITAFVISSVISPRSTFAVKEELVYSAFDDSFIIAGSVFEKSYGIPGSLKSQKNITLDLVAVVFDDKSSEGDPQVVQGIEDERLTEKMQFARAIPLIDRMLGLSNNKIQLYLKDNLKPDIMTALNIAKGDLLTKLRNERPQFLSQKGAEELPEPVEKGLNNGKEYFLQMIKDLENIQETEGGNALREEIIRTKQICERILSRL